MKRILILRSNDKRKADSPNEEIRIAGEIENEAKRSVPQNAMRSVPKTFRSQIVLIRSQSVPFRANRSAFPWCSRVCSINTLTKFKTIFCRIT